MAAQKKPKWLVTMLLTCAVASTELWAQGTNLALNKQVTANIQSGDYDFRPAMAVDGELNTRWDGYANEMGVDDTWLYVDLGSTQSFNHIRIGWEYAFARVYEIQTSNDATNWTTAINVEWSFAFQYGNAERYTDILVWGKPLVVGYDNIYFETPVSARYVKMQTIKRGSPYGVSIYELEIYADSPLPSPLPTFEAPTMNDVVKIDGKWNPVESWFFGPYQFSPFAFHNNSSFTNYDSLIYPGNNKIQWTSKTYLYSKVEPYVDGLTGVRYGPRALAGEACILPLSIESDLYTSTSFSTTHAPSVHPGTQNATPSTYNVTYDIWLSPGEQAALLGEYHPLEVMIMPFSAGAFIPHSYSTPADQVTLAGKVWDVFWRNQEEHNVVTFAPPAGQFYYEVEGNLKDFFNFISTKDWLNGTSHTGWMWFGAEKGICNFEVEVSHFGLGTTLEEARAATVSAEFQPGVSRMHSTPAVKNRTVVGRGILNTGSEKMFNLRGEYIGSHQILGGAVYIKRMSR